MRQAGGFYDDDNTSVDGPSPPLVQANRANVVKNNTVSVGVILLIATMGFTFGGSHLATSILDDHDNEKYKYDRSQGLIKRITRQVERPHISVLPVKGTLPVEATNISISINLLSKSKSATVKFRRSRIRKFKNSNYKRALFLTHISHINTIDTSTTNRIGSDIFFGNLSDKSTASSQLESTSDRSLEALPDTPPTDNRTHFSISSVVPGSRGRQDFSNPAENSLIAMPPEILSSNGLIHKNDLNSDAPLWETEISNAPSEKSAYSTGKTVPSSIDDVQVDVSSNNKIPPYSLISRNLDLGTPPIAGVADSALGSSFITIKDVTKTISISDVFNKLLERGRRRFRVSSKADTRLTNDHSSIVKDSDYAETTTSFVEAVSVERITPRGTVLEVLAKGGQGSSRKISLVLSDNFKTGLHSSTKEISIRLGDIISLFNQAIEPDEFYRYMNSNVAKMHVSLNDLRDGGIIAVFNKDNELVFNIAP